MLLTKYRVGGYTEFVKEMAMIVKQITRVTYARI